MLGVHILKPGARYGMYCSGTKMKALLLRNPFSCQGENGHLFGTLGDGDGFGFAVNGLHR